MNQRVIKKVRCNICSAGCPIDAYVEEGKLVSVEGSRDLPGQSGGLCSKGAASRQYVYNKDRILYPMKRIGKKGSGEFERVSWDEAYRMIAENLLRIKKNMVRRRQHFMRDIRNGTDRHFCGLPMLTGLRITVRNPVPVFSRRQWHGDPFMEMTSAFRI